MSAHRKISDVKVKPCPFCSGKAALEPMPSSRGWWRVKCRNYHCGGTNWAMGREEEALTAWNARAADVKV